MTDFRSARKNEQRALEDLQRRASLALGTYSEALLEHPDAIELPLVQIGGGNVIVAENAGVLLGFAVVLWEGNTAELDGLFVDPPFWRRGIGRELMAHAAALAVANGAETMRVIAATEARPFYEATGFVFKEDAPTRFGPALLLEIRL